MITLLFLGFLVGLGVVCAGIGTGLIMIALSGFTKGPGVGTNRLVLIAGIFGYFVMGGALCFLGGALIVRGVMP